MSEVAIGQFALAERIEFAWKNFEDQQATIRASDLKAGYLVTFLIFFGASTIPLGKEVIPRLHWGAMTELVTSAVYTSSYFVFAIGFIWALYLISQVLMPRVTRQPKKPTGGRELLYYEHVQRYADSGAYYDAVTNATPEEMLRNITDQVYELSLICKRKVEYLRAFTQAFEVTLAAWFVSTGIGFWIAVWK